MLIETLTWLYALLVLIFIVIILLVRRSSKVRVWIKMHPKTGQPMTEIGYLDMNGDNTAGEVHLSGSGSKVPIGRVIIDSLSKKDIGLVEVLTSDIDDETEKPRYKQCGYISFGTETSVDEYGYIYKHQKGKKKKELIGYCARPSAPNTPTIYGERSWRTLWLTTTLNAYLGLPDEVTPKKPVEVTSPAMFIGNDAQATEPNKVTPNGDAFSDFLKDSPDPAIGDANQEEELVAVPFSEMITDATKEDAPADTTTDNPTEGDSENTGDSEVSVPDSDSDSENTGTGGAGTENPEGENPEAENPEDTSATTNEDAPKDASDAVPPVPNKKKKEKKSTKTPVAICYYTGFHNSKSELPSEARACAYALLGTSYQRRKYAEYYKDQPYGWRDTAMLTSFIYSVLFLLLYTINTGMLQMPLVGDDFRAVGILITFYFVLWALVRLIKIDRIENSNSFQPKLDLFNKNLNLGFFNLAIIILALISGYFTFVYYDFDLLPLIFAIAFGVGINMTLYGANKPWRISSSYTENDEIDEEDETEVKNPEGDIARMYEWDIEPRIASHKVHGDLTLYFSAKDINDVRQCNPFFQQRKDRDDKAYILEMYNFLIEHKPMLARVRYIAAYINKLAQKQGLTPLEKIQFTLDFIQEPNIRFVNNGDCKSINYYEDYIRYPDETLYDREGDCNSKSLLAAMLFHVMGYNVLYMAANKFQHAAIGIEVSLVNLMEDDGSKFRFGSMDKINKISILENGKHYIYCETTGDRFTIGTTLEGMTIDDFEVKVLLPLDEDNLEEDGILLNDSQTCIYNWDLDSERGIALHGNFTLDFSKSQIEELRSVNPFQYYGHNSNTYEMNIRSMFLYLFEDQRRMEKVNLLADYIKAVTKNAGCNDLDTLQFALDFAQTPNIEYRLDVESASIDFMKEYMRFPDEVLFDKEGDCDCKSSLTAALFHALGHNVVIMLSAEKAHAAIGVEFRDDWHDQIQIENFDSVLFEHNGRKYLYCETTGDGFRIGHILENDTVKNYDNIVEILL